MKLAASLVSLAVLSGCIESLSPVIKPGTEEDRGKSVLLRFHLPPLLKPLTSEQEDKLLRFYAPGAPYIDLNFLRHKGGHYNLAITSPNAPEKRNPLMTFVDARFKVIGQYGEFRLLLVDMLLTIEGDEVGAGAGYSSGVWLVADDNTAFPGFIPCDAAMTNQMQKIAPGSAEPKCQSWKDQLPFAAFASYSIPVYDSQDLLMQVYADALASKSMRFMVDCQQFPAYAERIAGFSVVCMSWDTVVKPSP